jgi:hypothetical protein
MAWISATQSCDVSDQIQRSNDPTLIVQQWMGMRFPDGARAVLPLNHDRVAVIGHAPPQRQRHPALLVAYLHAIH